MFEGQQLNNNDTQLSTYSPWNWRQALVLLAIVVSGEMIFTLPFHVARYFRPTLVNVLGISHGGLGDAFAVYGIFAFLSYFPGGMLADRFSARKLMSISLVATATGGLYFVTLPEQLGLSILFGFWGITTVLLFWSAMIRATREWGGVQSQGRAFGLLDGGRGLLGATAGFIATIILVRLGANELEMTTLSDREAAMQGIILYYSGLTAIAAIIAWLVIPDTKPKLSRPHAHPLRDMRMVLRNPTAWLQAIIVFTAYCMYRGLDYYAIYMTDVLGMTEIQSSRLISLATYLRPVAAVATGFLADRLTTRNTLGVLFLLLVFTYLVQVFLGINGQASSIIILAISVTFLMTYALRSVYFALFEETNIAGHRTGITAGLVSVVGFAPDIFFNSLVGRMLDTEVPEVAFRHLFIILGLLSVLGVAASVIIKQNSAKA